MRISMLTMASISCSNGTFWKQEACQSCMLPLFLSYTHIFRTLKSAQALRSSDMISMIHRLERKSVTDKLPLTVRSHVRRNINKARDIKSVSDMT